MLPVAVRQWLEAAVAAPVNRLSPCGGGFGANVLRVTAGGAMYALKWAAGGLPVALISAEAHGLRTLAATATINVPTVVAVLASDGGGPAALLSTWLDGAGTSLDPVALGEELAALHRQTAPAFGFEADNFIGGTPQVNGWQPSWPAFFRTRRLLPQITLAATAGLLDAARQRTLERLLTRLDDRLAVSGAPALIHGDLWRGNVVAGPGGRPALIDPAVAYSHREAEIAFTELFGGFSPRFYAAYTAAWPLEPDYATRRPIYNLYHALNHLNLFGGSYLGLVDDLLRQCGV